MNEDQVEGKARQAEGQAQESWGDVKEKTDDTWDKAIDKADATWEKAKDKLDDLDDKVDDMKDKLDRDDEADARREAEVSRPAQPVSSSGLANGASRRAAPRFSSIGQGAVTRRCTALRRRADEGRSNALSGAVQVRSRARSAPGSAPHAHTPAQIAQPDPRFQAVSAWVRGVRCARQESNLRPRAPEARALSPELRAPGEAV